MDYAVILFSQIEDQPQKKGTLGCLITEYPQQNFQKLTVSSSFLKLKKSHYNQIEAHGEYST